MFIHFFCMVQTNTFCKLAMFHQWTAYCKEWDSAPVQSTGGCWTAQSCIVGREMAIVLRLYGVASVAECWDSGVVYRSVMALPSHFGHCTIRYSVTNPTVELSTVTHASESCLNVKCLASHRLTTKWRHSIPTYILATTLFSAQ